MKFFDPLIVRWRGDNQWVVEKELRCESADDDVIYVPAGTATDLASIPRVLWPILSPAGKWARSSVVHDWMYQQHLFRRLKCDNLFLECMAADRVRERAVIYRAVRMFGQRAYRSYG